MDKYYVTSAGAYKSLPADIPVSATFTEITKEQYDEWVLNHPIVPRVVSMRQARLALLQSGLLASVEAAINALPSPQKEAAQIEWEYSQEVQRDKELVAMLAPVLGLDDAALDQLFIQAATL